jgi:hypothetical protein
MNEIKATLPATIGGAEITRFNALRHGVLSRYTVLHPIETEERARDQRRLASQPCDIAVCRFPLPGRRFAGNVVALLASRAALSSGAVQGAFCE